MLGGVMTLRALSQFVVKVGGPQTSPGFVVEDSGPKIAAYVLAQEKEARWLHSESPLIAAAGDR